MTETQGSTHTPGPWTVEGKIVAAIIDKGNGRREVRAILEMIEGHQTEANTRLVVAGPDLLEALRGVCEAISNADAWGADTRGWESVFIARDAASALIEKATK